MSLGAIFLRLIKNIKQQCVSSDGHLINSNFDFDAADLDQFLTCNDDDSNEDAGDQIPLVNDYYQAKKDTLAVPDHQAMLS